MANQWTRATRETVISIPVKPLQTTVETEALLKGSLRDEVRLYYADGYAAIRNCEITGGKINASGRMRFQLLYAQGDLLQFEPMEVAVDFTQSIALPEGTANGKCVPSIQCTVMDVEARVMSGRVILRAIIQLQGSIHVIGTVSLISPQEENVSICQKTSTVSMKRVCGQGEVQSTIRDELPLSDVLQIKQTLFGHAHALVEDIQHTGNGHYAIIGTILLDTCHAADMPKRPIITTQHKIPFEQEIALSGETGTAVAAQTEVQDTAVLSQIDDTENGERILRCEVVLHTTVQSITTEEMQLLHDAYTMAGDNIEAIQTDISWQDDYFQETCAESGRLTLYLPDGSPRIRQALAAWMSPVLLQARPNVGRLQIEGIMRTTFLYLTDDSDLPVSVSLQPAFIAHFSTQTNPEDFIALDISECAVNAVTGDRAEVKYILHLTSSGQRVAHAPVVTEIQTITDNDEKHGISVRFVQPEEALWDIAKSYRVREEQILEMNNTDQITAGMPLLIMNDSRNQKQNQYEVNS